MSDIIIAPEKDVPPLKLPEGFISPLKAPEAIVPTLPRLALTRDLPEIIESNINQNQEIFNLTQDPEEERAKAKVAIMFSYSCGTIGTTEFMYENAKTIIDVLFGQRIEDMKYAAENLKDHWHYTWDVAELLKLYEKQWLEGDISEKTANAIEEKEKNLPFVDPNKDSLIEEFAHGVIDQLPMYQEAAREAGVYGLLLTAFGGASGFLTAGGAGAAIGAKAGATIGTAIGAAKGFFTYLGSHAYRDFIKVYDLDPKLARIGAFIIGAWEAGTEILLDVTAIDAVRTAPKLFQRTMQGAFLNLVHFLGHTLRTGAKEASQELIQELGTIVTEEIIKKVSNAYKETDFDPITWEEEVRRMEEAVRGGFIIAGGLTGIGISVSSLSQSIHAVYENPRLVKEYQAAREAEKAKRIIPPEVKEEVVAPPEVKPVPKEMEVALREVEEKIVKKYKPYAKVEESWYYDKEGKLIEHKRGAPTSIELDVIAEKEAVTYVHTHPRSTGYSPTDINFFIQKPFTQYIMHDPKGTWILEKPTGWEYPRLSAYEIIEKIKQIESKVIAENPDVSFDEIYHKKMEGIAQEFNLEFEYRPRPIEIKAKIIEAKIPPLEVEEFASEEEVAEYEKLEKAEEKGEFIPLSRYTERQRRLAERATTIKGRIRATVGKMSMEKLVTEEEALTATLKAEARVAKKAFVAGKKEEYMAFQKQKATLREIKRQREHRREMLSDLKKINTEKMSPAHAKPINRMIAEIDMSKPRKKTVARLEATRSYLEDNPDAELPDYVMENLKRLDKKNWQDMTMEEFESAHDAIMHHVHLEMKKQSIRVGLQYRNFIKTLIKSVSEMKSRKQISEETAFTDLPFDNVIKFAKAVKDTFGIRSDHYDLIIEKLSGANSTMDKIFYQVPKEGTLTEIAKRREYYKNFLKDLKNTDILKKIKDIDKWKREKVKVGGHSLTRGQRMALYRHSLHEDNRRHILEGGFGSMKKPTNIYKMTEKEMHKIIESLTKEEKLFAGEPIDNYFNQAGNDADKIFYEKNGYPMPRIEGPYYPIDVMPMGRGIEFQAEQEFIETKGKWTKVGIPKGRLERRVKSKAPIFLNDIAYDINKHVMWAAAYVGLEIPLSNASRLLYNNKFATEFRNRYSDITWKEVEKGLRDIAGDHYSYTTVETILMKLKNNLTPAFLGLNPFVMLKQPISFACYWPYIDIKYMMKGLTDFIVRPKEIQKMNILNSVEFAERVEGGYSRDITDVIRKKAERRLYGGKKGYKEVPMMGVQWFDQGAVNPGMHGAVLQVLDQFKEGKLSYQVKKALDMQDSDISKLSADDKVKLAYKYADYATERSQPMFSAIHRSSLSRGVPIEQLATQFSAFTNSALGQLRRAMNDLGMNRSKATMAAMAKVVFAVLIANSLAVAGLDELRDWMYGRKKKSFLLRILNTWAGYFYFIRDISSSVRSKIETGTFVGYDVELPVMRLPNLLSDTIADGVRGVTGADRKGIGKALDSGSELIFTSVGIPYGPVRNIIRGFTRR